MRCETCAASDDTSSDTRRSGFIHKLLSAGHATGQAGEIANWQSSNAFSNPWPSATNNPSPRSCSSPVLGPQHDIKYDSTYIYYFTDYGIH